MSVEEVKRQKILFLNRVDVEQLLSYRVCIRLMKEAMSATSAGKAIQPIRTSLYTPDGAGLLSMMPGYLKEPACLGIKVVSVFPENYGSGRPSHQGIVVLYDARHGAPLAIFEGGSITAIRTASASAIATKVLARSGSGTLTLLGYGEQARCHLAAIKEVIELKEVRVWGRSYERSSLFADENQAQVACSIEPQADIRRAIIGSDVVCTTTSAKEAFLKGEWLEHGMHINVVGSSIATAREVDNEAVARSELFVDYEESTQALGCEYREALAAGVIDKSHIKGEIGAILNGAIQGRTSSSAITMFKSLGMVSEDLIVADYLRLAAKEDSVGTLVEL